MVLQANVIMLSFFSQFTTLKMERLHDFVTVWVGDLTPLKGKDLGTLTGTEDLPSFNSPNHLTIVRLNCDESSRSEMAFTYRTGISL